MQPLARSVASAHPFRLCVFAGTGDGDRSAYQEAARACARAAARHDACLIYGGGGVGLMGFLADEAARWSVPVVGVFPSFLSDRERPPAGLTELHVVDSLHERKQLMADLSNAVLALPGGLGTLEEFAEAVTWSQLGIHVKPCGLLNVAGYYDLLLEFLSHAARSGFVREEDLVVAGSDVEELVELLWSLTSERAA